MKDYSSNTGKPPKFEDFSDDCCPHAESDTPDYIPVRLYCDGFRYDGKCYVSCGCGKLVIPVAKHHAHLWVSQNRAEYVKEGTTISEPGSCCGNCGKEMKDDEVDVATPNLVDVPVQKPDAVAVVKPGVISELEPVSKPALPQLPGSSNQLSTDK